ncbi:MAG: tetratricopeptide repeat protein, partial [Bacteroidales bacterium]|nr:tetratricopeptide repeat protein [Bacteroidales bacterium]
MKYKLLLYCTITILLFISCNKSSETPDNKKESTIIQESIKVLETISPPDSLIYFAKQKEEKLQLLLSDSLLGKFREDLAVLFYKRSDFNTAKVYFIKSEESYRKANLPLQANQMLANRAVINDLTGDYKEAITIYIKVVDYFKQQNDSTSWASALGNIGAVYEEMGMADKAIHYDKLSLAINLDMGDTLRAATKYNNIGVAFSELKNIPDSAVYYYTKAYKIYKSKGHALYLALVASNLGMQHIMASNLELAEKYLNEAELVFDTLTNINGQGTNQRYYAELYNAQNNKHKAVEYFKKAMDAFKKTDDKKSLMETGNLLSNVYISMGNFSEATQMMQYANTLKDSLMNIDNLKIIADMESKYQLNEKNNTIEILQLEETLSKKQIRIQLVFISFLIIVFILLVLIYYFSVQKSKLKEKELRLELQNYILRIDKLQIAVDEKGNKS